MNLKVLTAFLSHNISKRKNHLLFSTNRLPGGWLKKYNRALSSYTDKLLKHPDVVAIIKFGSSNITIYSDIDLIIIVKNKISDTNGLSRLLAIPNNSVFFMHKPFIIPENNSKALINTFFGNYKNHKIVFSRKKSITEIYLKNAKHSQRDLSILFSQIEYFFVRMLTENIDVHTIPPLRTIEKSVKKNIYNAIVFTGWINNAQRKSDYISLLNQINNVVAKGCSEDKLRLYHKRLKQLNQNLLQEIVEENIILLLFKPFLSERHLNRIVLGENNVLIFLKTIKIPIHIVNLLNKFNIYLYNDSYLRHLSYICSSETMTAPHHVRNRRLLYSQWLNFLKENTLTDSCHPPNRAMLTPWFGM